MFAEPTPGRGLTVVIALPTAAGQEITAEGEEFAR